MDFTALLRSWLKKKGVTHAALAHRLHVHPAYVSQVATGRSKIAIDRIQEWVDALELTGDDRERFTLEAQLLHAPAAVRNIVIGKWAGVLNDLEWDEISQLDEPLRKEVLSATTSPEPIQDDIAERLAKRVFSALKNHPVTLIPSPRPSTPDEISARLKVDRQEILGLEDLRNAMADELSAAKKQLTKATEEIARQQQDILALSRQLAEMRQQLERQNPQPPT